MRSHEEWQSTIGVCLRKYGMRSRLAVHVSRRASLSSCKIHTSPKIASPVCGGMRVGDAQVARCSRNFGLPASVFDISHSEQNNLHDKGRLALCCVTSSADGVWLSCGPPAWHGCWASTSAKLVRALHSRQKPLLMMNLVGSTLW